jgi:hypothetical protein
MRRSGPAASQLYGAWELASWELWRGDRLDAYPHGAEGEGRLQLAASGAMAMFRQRRDWKGVDRGTRPGPDAFIALGGDWRAEEGGLRLDVRYASEPRLIGASLRYRARLDRRRLVIEADEETGRADAGFERMVWRKLV